LLPENMLLIFTFPLAINLLFTGYIIRPIVRYGTNTPLLHLDLLLRAGCALEHAPAENSPQERNLSPAAIGLPSARLLEPLRDTVHIIVSHLLRCCLVGHWQTRVST